MRIFATLPLIVWAVAAFAGGIAAVGSFHSPPAVVLGTLCGTGILWALARFAGRRDLRAAAAVGVFAALGAAHATALTGQQPAWTAAADGRFVVAQGVITSMPEVAFAGWRATIRLTALSVGPPASTVRRRARGREPPSVTPSGLHMPALQPVAGLVRVTGYGPPPPDAAVGAEIRVSARFRTGRVAGNPGERTERQMLAQQGLAGVLRVDSGAGTTVVRPAGWSIRGILARGRQRVVASVQRSLPDPHGGLLLSLLLGIDTYLSPDLYERFRRAGLVHLLVVSGAQVAIVAGACAWAARRVRLHAVPSAIVTGLGVVAFAVMAGWAPSIGRAVIMAAVALGAVTLDRPTDRGATLATAALALLTASPPVLFDVGFQLSFAATWGLLFITPALQRQLAGLGPWLASAIAVTLGAQLAVAPLLAAHFQGVVVAGLLANMLALPLIAIIVPVGLALIPVALLAPSIGEPLLRLLQPGLQAVEWVGTWFGDLSWAVIPTPPVSALAAAAGFGLLGIFLCLASGGWRPPRAGRLVIVAASILVVTLWYTAATRPPSLLTITAFDVGQGDSILIRSPSGRNVLIDGGGETSAEPRGWDVGRMRVVPALRRIGVRRLDVMILSHPHEDHVGGLTAVIENIPVGLVLDPGVAYPSPAYARFLRAVEAHRTAYQTARASMRMDLGAGAQVLILYPPQPIPQIDGDPVHAGSVVARLEYGRTAAVLTGDLESPGERYLLDQNAPLAAQVLKVGHHGSRTSTAADFLARVNPQIAVISVGVDNTFGHPHPSTLEALAAAGVRVYRTDRDGAVTLTSDGSAWQGATAVEQIHAGIR